MKGIVGLFSLLMLPALVGTLACSKDGEKKKDIAQVAQDTMLLHDLAEANRNTAAAEATDTVGAVVRARGGAGDAALLNAGNAPTVVPQGTPSDQQRATPNPRPVAVNRTTEPSRQGASPTRPAADDSQPSSSGDACSSPTPADQRTCLNRSIVANDADLNRVYKDLIAQSRLSGGDELEQRFRQSQREWVDRRDAECRQQTSNSGPLWARPVAKCLAEYSNRRTAELQRSLNNLRGQ